MLADAKMQKLLSRKARIQDQLAQLKSSQSKADRRARTRRACILGGVILSRPELFQQIIGEIAERDLAWLRSMGWDKLDAQEVNNGAAFS